MFQAAEGGELVSVIFTWYASGPLEPNNHCMNLSAYLKIVAHAHPFMTTVYQYSHGCFQQDYVPCYKAQIT